MARRGSLLILTSLAALTLATPSASAGHARRCAGAVEAHNVTCGVANRLHRAPARPDSTGTVAQSTVRVGERKLRQDISVYGNWIDYHVVATDPDGLYPYCVTIRFEKRVRGEWKPLARRDLSAYRHECMETPAEGESDSETFAAWDTIIYPGRALYDKFFDGTLRVHGITDLGGDLSYRR